MWLLIEQHHHWDSPKWERNKWSGRMERDCGKQLPMCSKPNTVVLHGVSNSGKYWPINPFEARWYLPAHQWQFPGGISFCQLLLCLGSSFSVVATGLCYPWLLTLEYPFRFHFFITTQSPQWKRDFNVVIIYLMFLVKVIEVMPFMLCLTVAYNIFEFRPSPEWWSEVSRQAHWPFLPCRNSNHIFFSKAVQNLFYQTLECAGPKKKFFEDSTLKAQNSIANFDIKANEARHPLASTRFFTELLEFRDKREREREKKSRRDGVVLS